MSTHLIQITGLVASLALIACSGGESLSAAQTPDIQRQSLAQLSAGGGIAGYDFYAEVGGVYKRVGSLLVVEDASDPASGYYDETEYWRFDPVALDETETGAVLTFDIDFLGKSKSFDQGLVDDFETGTETFTAWQVNRLFELASNPTLVWNQPANGQVLYTMEGKGWGKADGHRITYYLELDFTIGEDFPEMTWYIDYADFEAWQTARGDDGRIYEVRLRNNTELDQTTVGVGYELQTIK